MSPVPAPLGPPAVTGPRLALLLPGLAGNPSAPPAVLVRLAAAGEARHALVRRRDLPPETAGVLAAATDADLRSQLAANPSVPPSVRVVLAGDADPRVRTRLAAGAPYFTTVGVHGIRSPGPLPREVYEALARDPDPEVRRALARNPHLPDDLRITLLDDADERTATLAATEWPRVPVDHISRLLRATDPHGQWLLLGRLDGPLPTGTAHLLIAGLDAAAADGKELDTDLLCGIAATADLDLELTARFLADPDARPAVAGNPTLPAEHVADLANDPDNRVRAAVVARRGLEPSLRESVPADFDEGDTAVVDWLLTGDLPERDLAAYARSRHQIFRKTLAMRPGLPDEIVELLAHDESFTVRLFVCERQPNAPARLLARTAETWTGHSRWDLLAHRNFPGDAAVRLTGSARPADRAVAAAHPGLPADTIEALLADGNVTVRRRAAVNPVLPAGRLVELLASSDPAVAVAAATNRALPVPSMLHLLDQAGL
ncbi:hypothetical protein ABT026_21775 [Streptomyces sp. NPDC002734]|uniref:hypothetical protein n=1 Tax=Streptomyces sp. NPDC002734 TaxID=3154426 RepID=UPI0033296D4D